MPPTRRSGRPGTAPHPLEDYRRLLGGGVRNLFRAALPPGENSEGQIDQCVRIFEVAYRAVWNVHTQPYLGITSLIAELAERNVPLAVLSNKPHEFTRLCIAEFFGDAPVRPDDPGRSESPGIGPFAIVAGQRPGVPVKPDPTAVLEFASQLDVAPADCLYVGDTRIDMETAASAGMRAIGVSWGFRDRQELVECGAETVIDDPRDLLPLLSTSV